MTFDHVVDRTLMRCQSSSFAHVVISSPDAIASSSSVVVRGRIVAYGSEHASYASYRRRLLPSSTEPLRLFPSRESQARSEHRALSETYSSSHLPARACASRYGASL